MATSEISKIRDIDRAERIRTGYKMVDGALQKLDVNWDSPSWSPEGDDEYSVAAQIKFCQEHLDRNGRLYGAFVADKLVGAGIFEPDIAPQTAKLAFLYVSKPYRQFGVGRQIEEALSAEAKNQGATRMYVSATPSGSAVGFYLSQGFRPTTSPVPALFELEPDDIHMDKSL